MSLSDIDHDNDSPILPTDTDTDTDINPSINPEFQNILDYASAIKLSQPEQVDRRQRWESQPYYLKQSVLYNNQEDQQYRLYSAAADSNNIELLLTAAESNRLLANQHYINKEYIESSALYERILSWFHYIVRTTTITGDQDFYCINNINASINTTINNTNTNTELLLLLLLQCYSNLSAVYIELKLYTEAIQAAQAAIILYSNNNNNTNNNTNNNNTNTASLLLIIKCNYRIGLSYSHLENYSKSIEYYNNGLMLVNNSNNGSIVLTKLQSKLHCEFNKIQLLIQSQSKIDKQRYGGFFNNTELYSDINTNSSNNNSNKKYFFKLLFTIIIPILIAIIGIRHIWINI